MSHFHPNGVLLLKCVLKTFFSQVLLWKFLFVDRVYKEVLFYTVFLQSCFRIKCVFHFDKGTFVRPDSTFTYSQVSLNWVSYFLLAYCVFTDWPIFIQDTLIIIQRFSVMNLSSLPVWWHLKTYTVLDRTQDPCDLEKQGERRQVPVTFPSFFPSTRSHAPSPWPGDLRCPWSLSVWRSREVANERQRQDKSVTIGSRVETRDKRRGGDHRRETIYSYGEQVTHFTFSATNILLTQRFFSFSFADLVIGTVGMGLFREWPHWKEVSFVKGLIHVLLRFLSFLESNKILQCTTT